MINPWWFYLINWIIRMDAFLSAFITACILLSIIFFIYSWIYWTIHGDMDTEDESNAKIARKKQEIQRKRAFKCLIAGMVSFLLWTFIPSETTMYKMMIARILTKENIQDMHEFIAKDLNAMVDKITESAVKIKEAEQSGK